MTVCKRENTLDDHNPPGKVYFTLSDSLYGDPFLKMAKVKMTLDTAVVLLQQDVDLVQNQVVEVDRLVGKAKSRRILQKAVAAMEDSTERIKKRLNDVILLCEDKFAPDHKELIDLTNKLLHDVEAVKFKYYAREDDEEAKEAEEKKKMKQDKMAEPPVKRDSVKVPSVTVPVFSGDDAEWPCFRELFESIYLNNDNFSKAEKHQTLRTLITGDAANQLRGISITSDNFELAWDILQQRYGNLEVMKSRTVRSLLRERTAGTSVQELRRLLGNLQVNHRQVQNQGIDMDILVTEIYKEKLPAPLREDLERGAVPTTTPKGLIEWLGRVCIAKEATTASKGQQAAAAPPTMTVMNTGAKPKKTKNADGNQKDGASKKDENGTSGETASKPDFQAKKVAPGRCPFCDGNVHPPEKCDKLRQLPVNQRWAVCVANQLCFRCLGRHEVGQRCEADFCSTCSKPHHPALCKKRKGN